MAIDKDVIDQNYLAQAEREARWERRIKEPVIEKDHDIEIHILDRESTEKSIKNFSENQLHHAIANPRTHRDPEQSGDPDIIRVDLSPMEKLFARLRDTGRAYARSHGAHITKSYGSFAGVWAGVDKLEFLSYERMAKKSAAMQGEIRFALLMQAAGDDLMSYTIHVYYAVPKIGTKLHRDRMVVDYRSATAKWQKDVPVGGLGREQKALRTGLSYLREQVYAQIADFDREVAAENKFLKSLAAKAKAALAARSDRKGQMVASGQIGWLVGAIAAAGAIVALVQGIHFGL